MAQLRAAGVPNKETDNKVVTRTCQEPCSTRLPWQIKLGLLEKCGSGEKRVEARWRAILFCHGAKDKDKDSTFKS